MQSKKTSNTFKKAIDNRFGGGIMPLIVCENGTCDLPFSEELNESCCSICCIDCENDNCPLKEME